MARPIAVGILRLATETDLLTHRRMMAALGRPDLDQVFVGF